ncbi:MAG: PQQ-binding-like beta-propeller repeat protein, partial [Chloroflexi bacterium]|nr:PQQ-binding-like beta-propeller repeat protein [Chloroflexota bacterium]
SAVDVNTGAFLWHTKMPTPMVGGATATASNLVFTGDQRGILYAFDARSGRILWRARLGLAFGSAPIVYAIGGTEYVAAPIGGSAVTGAQRLGNVGAVVAVLKLGGKPIKPFHPPGVTGRAERH